MKRSRGWVGLLVLVQVVGLVCMGAWQHVPQTYRSIIWGGSFLLLFPGNVVSTIFVERLFWHSRLSLVTMSLMEIPLLLAINTLIWLCAAWAFSRLLARHDGLTGA